MLKGYADEHVVLALVEALRRRGMDAVRVQDRGREETGDADLLDEAQADERVMLTNDTDFLRLTFERAAKREEFAPHLFLAPTATVYRPACARHYHARPDGTNTGRPVRGCSICEIAHGIMICAFDESLSVSAYRSA